MKKCPNCKNDIADTTKICPDCNMEISDAGLTGETEEKSSKKRTYIIIFILVFIVIGVAAAFVYMSINYISNEQTYIQPPKVTQTKPKKDQELEDKLNMYHEDKYLRPTIFFEPNGMEENVIMAYKMVYNGDVALIADIKAECSSKSEEEKNEYIDDFDKGFAQERENYKSQYGDDYLVDIIPEDKQPLSEESLESLRSSTGLDISKGYDYYVLFRISGSKGKTEQADIYKIVCISELWYIL